MITVCSFLEYMLLVNPLKNNLGPLCTTYLWPCSKGFRKILRLLYWVIVKYCVPSLTKIIHRRECYVSTVYKK